MVKQRKAKKIMPMFHENYKDFREIISWFGSSEIVISAEELFCFEIICFRHDKPIRASWGDWFTKVECEKLSKSYISELLKHNLDLVEEGVLEEEELDKKSHRKSKKYTY